MVWIHLGNTETSRLFLGILIGYDDNLSEDIEESFRKSSLTHLLAVSGSHIVYIISGSLENNRNKLGMGIALFIFACVFPYLILYVLV